MGKARKGRQGVASKNKGMGEGFPKELAHHMTAAQKRKRIRSALSRHNAQEALIDKHAAECVEELLETVRQRGSASPWFFTVAMRMRQLLKDAA